MRRRLRDNARDRLAGAPRPRRDVRARVRAASALLATAVALAAQAPGARAQSGADIENTAHNFSVTGTGSIRAASETRLCIFCHTPHNATPMSPLWNRVLDGQVYEVYASPTLAASPIPQPSGATKLCLSCHDGTIAVGATLRPATGVAMAGADTLDPASLSNFGLDLSSHHPVSFSYQDSLPNLELVPSPPPDLPFGDADEVHCTTCHDPHKDVFGKFLLKDNRNSALCTTCHQIQDWPGSAHATSTASVVGILPRPPKTWPQWTTLGEWGCEACHTPHFAPTAQGLLNFTTLPPDPFTCTTAGCHNSDPVAPHSAAGATSGLTATAMPVGRGADIAAQVRKRSGHRERPGAMQARAGGARVSVRDATCVDCHNPHRAAASEATIPDAGGALRGVAGVDRNGVDVASVRYEYEVCLKCHGDQSVDRDYVPRVIGDPNKRYSFDPSNPSFHPVFATGRSGDVPSIPSSLEPTLTAQSRMGCTSCHADDEGATNGPHGSDFPPILRERYETTDYTMENAENYALCYRCHDRGSILSDASFRTATARTTTSGGGHSGHLADGAPCSACHEPHGVSERLAGGTPTGSHTHLVNFDTTIVAPRAGASVPVFEDKGAFAGSCTLTCHGFDHDGESYP